jgi:radical SAM superfamily enzyme YgiQ (UPF0313 family)
VNRRRVVIVVFLRQSVEYTFTNCSIIRDQIGLSNSRACGQYIDPALRLIGSRNVAVRISFADLSHTGQVVSANTFPLGAGMVAAYARQELGEEIDVDIFRYPDDYSAYLKEGPPRIACFTIFAWNMHLSHEYAKRIKADSPETVTVFGGANFPTDLVEQEVFFRKWPAIDFCVEGEGEMAFVALYEALKAVDFDAVAVKKLRTEIPNTCYVVDGTMIKGRLLPRIANLNVIPSVYDHGFMDKFFDDHLIPMIETTRGCPYACTFCHEGSLYYNKTRRIAPERIAWELDYIVEHVKVPDFIITDLNFGMFEGDLDTTRHLARLQDEHDWPKFVTIATAKNHKERVIEASRILRGALNPGAPVQSTNPTVLKNVKRKNLPLDTATKAIANTTLTDDAASFSEIILALPGDTKEAHFRSNYEIVDTGISLLRNYQFMMLPGTEAASRTSRKEHGLVTRFRIKPMNFGDYGLLSENFVSAEIEEICIGSKTMSYMDYRECRALDLVVEIFNNNGIFLELVEFLARAGVSRSNFLREVHIRAVGENDVISGLFDAFRIEEEKNLWEDEEALAAFFQQPSVMGRYLDGEFGTNEIYKYRALAVFSHMQELHDIAFGAARSLLRACGSTDDTFIYLDELAAFSLARKQNFLDTAISYQQRFHFDFVTLVEKNFALDPFAHRRPEGVEIELSHTERQRSTVDGYQRQFGTTAIGLGRILNRAHVGTMYRRARFAEMTSLPEQNRSAPTAPAESAAGSSAHASDP